LLNYNRIKAGQEEEAKQAIRKLLKETFRGRKIFSLTPQLSKNKLPDFLLLSIRWDDPVFHDFTT